MESVVDRQELLREIKEKNDIVSVISEYTTLKRSGRGLTGLCPFHSEKTPSFNVNQAKQFFYCFGCGKGGDVISFIMKVENLDFIGAAKRLAQRAGIDWPEYQPVSEEERKKEQLYKLNKLAAAFFNQCLIKTENGEPARRYLSTRKIAPETCSAFGLGYAPAGWHHLTELLKQKQVALEEAEKIGLVGFGENGFYDRFRERLIFPIMDLRGNIVGFGGRIFDNSQPKYLNSPESVLFHKSNLLYGLYQAKETIRRKQQVIIVEGYLDVIQAHQAGFTQAIASLGTALTREHVKQIKRYATEAVLAYDADNAGRNATAKGIELLQEAGLEIKILDLPAGHDPDSLIREEGAAAFENLLQNRMNLVDYKINQVVGKYDVNNPEGKAGAVREVLPELASVDSTIAREAYIRRISREVGVSETAVLNELRRWIRNNGKNSQVLDRINNNSYTNEINTNNQPEVSLFNPENLTPLQKAIFGVEKELLQLTLQEYDKFARIKEELKAEDFRFEVWRTLFTALDQKKLSAEGSEIVLDELASSTREIAATLLAEHEVRNKPGDLTGILNRLKMLHIQEAIQSLTNQISTGRDPNGQILGETELKTRILEFTELKRRLQKEFPHFTAEI
ncbi:MAG TPA: DNA primase [Bacillota bacterium]|nr:DNA primase [Bacillota bacterium]